MFFRWDWLRPVLTAPIVPTLGPVHPDALTSGIFEDILRAADTRDFLPYDKDRRWGGEKGERVLREDVVHRRERTLIPTLAHRGRDTVRVFAYGHQDNIVKDAAELAARLAAVHDVASARVVRPLGPRTAHPHGTRIQLKDFTTGPCPAPDGPVRPVTAWPAAVRGTFATFARDMAADGLAFLHTRMQADHCGPVLATAVAGRVVGAIGPMEVRPDAIGRPQLMPQYFAVLLSVVVVIGHCWAASDGPETAQRRSLVGRRRALSRVLLAFVCRGPSRTEPRERGGRSIPCGKGISHAALPVLVDGPYLGSALVTTSTASMKDRQWRLESLIDPL